MTTVLVILHGINPTIPSPPPEGVGFTDPLSGTFNVLKTTGHTNTSLKILEIGCGSGAFLKVLEPFSAQLTGIDYSAKQIQTCQLAMPDGNFSVCEAENINFSPNSFDLILSNSVFQYFPDLDYTTVVLNKMLKNLKKGGVGVILDLADVEYKENYLEWKKREIGGKSVGTYPTQMYFKKIFFKRFSEEKEIHYRLENQNISGPEFV